MLFKLVACKCESVWVQYRRRERKPTYLRLSHVVSKAAGVWVWEEHMAPGTSGLPLQTETLKQQLRDKLQVNTHTVHENPPRASITWASTASDASRLERNNQFTSLRSKSIEIFYLLIIGFYQTGRFLHAFKYLSKITMDHAVLVVSNALWANEQTQIQVWDLQSYISITQIREFPSLSS